MFFYIGDVQCPKWCGQECFINKCPQDTPCYTMIYLDCFQHFELVELPTISRLITKKENGKERTIEEKIFDKSSDQIAQLVDKACAKCGTGLHSADDCPKVYQKDYKAPADAADKESLKKEPLNG